MNLELTKFKVKLGMYDPWAACVQGKIGIVWTLNFIRSRCILVCVNLGPQLFNERLCWYEFKTIQVHSTLLQLLLRYTHTQVRFELA